MDTPSRIRQRFSFSFSFFSSAASPYCKPGPIYFPRLCNNCRFLSLADELLLSCRMTHDLAGLPALWFPGRPLHVLPVRAVHPAAGVGHVEHHGGVRLVHLLRGDHILPWIPGLCQQGKKNKTAHRRHIDRQTGVWPLTVSLILTLDSPLSFSLILHRCVVTVM